MWLSDVPVIIINCFEQNWLFMVINGQFQCLIEGRVSANFLLGKCFLACLTHNNLRCILWEVLALFNLYVNKATIFLLSIVTVICLFNSLLTLLIVLVKFWHDQILFFNKFIFDIKINLREFFKLDKTVVIFITLLKDLIDDLLAVIFIHLTLEQVSLNFNSIKPAVAISIDLPELLLKHSLLFRTYFCTVHFLLGFENY